jgi:hypothetical protein
VLRSLACLALGSLLAAAARPTTIPSLPTTERLVVLGSTELPLPPEGQDATAAIQAGLDRGGIVILPSGRYRIDGRLDLWKGVRLIGVGPSKPLLLRPQDGADGYLVQFRSDRPKPGEAPNDANNDTFGSGLINLVIDYRPAGFAVRYRVAQLCVIEDVDFLLGPDSGGIHQMANVIRACRFVGGRVGIESGPPVAWQTLLADCEFSGQREAAVISHGTAPMLLGCRFSQLPVALRVGGGKPEMVLFEAARFKAVDCVLEAAVSSSAYSAFNLLDSQGTATPLLIRRGTDDVVAAPAADWSLDRVIDGLVVRVGATVEQQRETVIGERSAQPVRRAAAPGFQDLVSVTDFGAVGDGTTDCTAAFRQALASGDGVYVPPGRWLLRDTITLDGEDRLIGLHPRAAVLVLAVDAPGYGDPAQPKPVLAVAPGSSASMRGIGFGHSPQPGTIFLHWSGGGNSRLADCWTQWGPKGKTGPLIELLVDGGGTFTNLWLVNATSRHAMVVRDTRVPGRVDLASLEHHDPQELVMERVSGWTLHGIQTERGENEAPALRLEGCHDFVFGNLYLYRASRSREQRDAGIVASDCATIRVHGLHVYAGTWGGGRNYDHAIRLPDHDLAVEARVAAALILP